MFEGLAIHRFFAKTIPSPPAWGSELLCFWHKRPETSRSAQQSGTWTYEKRGQNFSGLDGKRQNLEHKTEDGTTYAGLSNLIYTHQTSLPRSFLNLSVAFLSSDVITFIGRSENMEVNEAAYMLYCITPNISVHMFKECWSVIARLEERGEGITCMQLWLDANNSLYTRSSIVTLKNTKRLYW